MPRLQGLTTDDVDGAAEWYSDALGVTPYFRHPRPGLPRAAADS